MKNYLVSVIMPCYNEKKEHFIEAIESILKQTYKNLELMIILDNPENDLLKEIALEFTDFDDRVKFYINDKNLGLVGTLNRGVSLASGDIIVRLDSDDIAKSNRIEEQIKYIDKYDIVSSNFAFISNFGVVIRHRKFPSDCNEIEIYLKTRADCMYHTTWMLKKSIYYKLGLYRNIGPFEDYDFLLRALSRKLKLYNHKMELNYVRINPIGISYNNKVLQHLGSEYLRENYYRINSIEENDIKNYINSELGKKRANEYIKFYKITTKVYSSKNLFIYYFRLILYGPYLAVTNYYGRKKVWVRIKSYLNK